MDEYEMYYFDDDTRNATRDHRPSGSRPLAVVRPRRPVAANTNRPMAVYPPSSMGPAYSPPFVPSQYVPSQMMYANYPTYPTEGITAASLLNRWTIPQLLELGAQAFAALQSLPQPPNASESVETNVANIITYQKLLAEHAKRDEQIRTLGALVARLAA